MMADVSGTTRTPRQDAVAALQSQAAAARQSLQSAQESADRASSDTFSADSQLSTAESYVRQAEWDTPQTDSSWAGRAAAGPYHFAESEITSAGFEARDANGSADDAGKVLNDAESKLKALEADLRAQGDAYKQAADLAAAARSSVHDGGAGAAAASDASSTGEWKLSDGGTQLQFGEGDLNQIQFDGPGRDVSMYARACDGYLRTADWDLQDAQRSFDAASEAAREGDGKTAAGQHTLQQLMAELQKVEGSAPAHRVRADRCASAA